MLLNKSEGERVVLRAEHVFGRNPERADTLLADPEVSALHAIVRWSNGRWSVVDHSRNGTFLDGRALPTGQWTPLLVGQKLSFGRSAHHTWEVVELGPPATLLLPAQLSYPVITLDPSNLLPTADNPELAIYRTDNGEWIAERDGDAHPLRDGQSVQLNGTTYSLHVRDAIDETLGARAQRPQADVVLRFRVSLDEEHTALQLVHGTEAIDLGERSHHYCLVTLARKRAADAAIGLTADAQGWLSSTELSKLLRIDYQHLNIQVFRARSQLMSALPHEARLACVVERRRGELRFGALAFEVMRDGIVESSYGQW